MDFDIAFDPAATASAAFVPVARPAPAPAADGEIDLSTPLVATVASSAPPPGTPLQPPPHPSPTSHLAAALSRPPRPASLPYAWLDALKEQGFPPGLAAALHESCNIFPLRIWVVDNSGSMRATDGCRFVPTKKPNEVVVVECTRWREIQDTVEYHANVAALLRAPTVFRMLNDPGKRAGPSTFAVACGPTGRGDEKAEEESIQEELRVAREVMTRASPGGVTPLGLHIREIREEVAACAPALRESGRRVAIVLATDGLPTDDNGICNEYYKRDFVEAIKGLEGLPVWVVVRLCTDDDEVVSYYNEIDVQLELSVEVLDDFTREAEEVHAVNRWLTYGLPLHRCREMGFSDRLMDLLEERPLTKDELRDFCRLLFGVEKMDGVPEASLDVKGFANAIDKLQEGERRQWNPLKKAILPWINTKKLRKDYGVRRWSVAKPG